LDFNSDCSFTGIEIWLFFIFDLNSIALIT
jgi:hypothetical protein